MYDELVKDLRESAPKALAEADFDFVEGWIKEAADAIEGLQGDNAALNETVSNLIQQIAELSKPRWISVTEQLPSYGDWVLGIGPKKGYYVCEYRGVTQWRRDGCDPWFSAKGSSVTITHWMPLPEPPKAEEGK